MNTIKFIVGITVIGFVLMGFITLDPAFKGTSKSNSVAKELSMNGTNLINGFQVNLDQ
jgi:hypothetical protein